MIASLDTGAALDRARSAFAESLPEHVSRLGWSPERVHAEQTRRLRILLAIAKERSPFHAARLAHVEPDRFELDDLGRLPVMTKSEMMADYDDVVTDRRLTRARVEAHLARLGEDVELLENEFVALASGGSSGVRGIFTYRSDEAIHIVAAVLRSGIAQMSAEIGWPPPGPLRLAMVAAPVSVHATRVLPAFADGAIAEVNHVPVTLPFPAIVDRVQSIQPTLLTGYPSIIARLADEQVAGRLAIAPQAVSVTSEQLTADLRQRIMAGFGMPPVNSFGSSEGLIGTAPPGSPVFDFAGDLAVIELVDEHDQPVAPGVTSHHVLMTNLFNHTQPLIRYRLDDRMTAAEPGDHGHPRASLEGRADESLVVGGVPVHALAVRSALVRSGGVSEYQVRVIDRSIVVSVVPESEIDPVDVAERIRAAVLGAGADPAEVIVETIDAIPRDPRTGKVHRFVNG